MVRADGLLARVHVDGTLLAALLLVCSFGLVVLYSATEQSTALLVKQLVRIALGLAAMVMLAQLSPDQIARWSPAFYLAGLGLLVAVMFFGTCRGATRWLEIGPIRFQPSEMMKLAVPIAAAAYLKDQRLPLSRGSLAVALGIIVLPALLIFQQPDLGTALLVAAAGLFVLILAGLSWRLIGAAALAAACFAPVGWYLLHDYQRQRILTLLNPQADPLGSGYHIIQSTIAVGSGGISGKGWLNGTQSHLEFLPERATDFIFAVFCEEFGFVGVLMLLCAYALVVFRGLVIAANAQTRFGKLLAGSLTLTFFIYIFVNMGMVTGQLPVVGVPLPLVSYGGTSMVTLLAGFGILMSVQTHRRFLTSN